MPEEGDEALKRTSRWLVQRFGSYYSTTKLHLPPRYTRREWGFMYFDKSYMNRHISFERRSQIQDYFRKEVPRHAYYSTAYYTDPGAHTMIEKGWQGATLIFDLDADHLEGAYQMEYGEMLAAVKKEFLKLINIWLVGKLGVDPDDIGIVFSGGRGYHAHIDDPRVLELNTFERREIIDLITGKADISQFLFEEPIHSGKRMDGRGYTRKTYRLPDPNIGNWKGDLSRVTIQWFTSLDIMVKNDMEHEAIEVLSMATGKNPDESKDFLDFLLKVQAGQRRIDRLIHDRRLDFSDELPRKFWKTIANNIFVNMVGEADEPVTADTKRLIRLPTSLHGKSGLRVMELTRDQLDDFDPLVDAIAFSDDFVEVEGVTDTSFDLGGESHALAEGRRTSIPEHAAVFACLRGMAQIPD